MSRSRKAVIVLLAIVAVGMATWRWWGHSVAVQPVKLRGAVLVRSDDVDKQIPIAGVRVSVSGGLASRKTWSSANGFFDLTLDDKVKAGQPVILQFRDPQYQPLDLTVFAGDRLALARMVPIVESSPVPASSARTVVSDVKIRYLTQTTTLMNVGSVVKTFRVVNTANVPCNRRYPCSPDEKWKATIGSATLEAPGGNIFANGRVSCIAGPCPFTKIRYDGFSRGGPMLRVEVMDWSSTTTFLFEAEVFQSMIGDSVRYSYPVIFGQTLHFTVPADAEGLCIEADLNRQSIVFPLGPEPLLSWASCTESASADHAELFQCELKPDYGFK
jgi:hypothetical protein